MTAAASSGRSTGGAFSIASLRDAAARVHAQMPPTPQYDWPLLQGLAGARLWVKHENHTPVGAFKVRGGLVYLDGLVRREPTTRAVMSATRGNHGQSIARAARSHDLPVTIFVPHGNSREKNAAMRAFGAELVETGHDFQAAREAAQRFADERGWHMVPSFHDDLVAGVASYALELFDALPALDTVVVPIGLGSGACGLVAARDALGLATEIVGVVSAGAPTYALSLAAGQPGVATAERGVACERQFLCRREDAHAVVGAGLGRRQQEGRLRQVGPAREGRHLRIRQSAAVVHDGQRIAAQRLAGEDIELRETALHLNALPARGHRPRDRRCPRSAPPPPAGPTGVRVPARQRPAPRRRRPRPPDASLRKACASPASARRHSR
jgi:threonine dehydratase